MTCRCKRLRYLLAEAEAENARLREEREQARLAGFQAGREWVRQGGREFADGWRAGIKRAFEYLSERLDERVMLLNREQPYSWEPPALRAQPAESPVAQGEP
jgi:hypothetical protein